MTRAPCVVSVIADDLTGAASIGGEFTKWGLLASISRGLQVHKGTAPVLVFDTASRFANEKLAQQRVQELTERISTRCSFAIKKIDSGFAGNTAAEVAAFLGAWRGRVIVVPACPTVGWSTWRGRQEHPSRHGVDVVATLLRDSGLVAATLGLDTVRTGALQVKRGLLDHGARVTVVDAETPEDLVSIAEGAIDAGVTGFVGTYGLGAAIAPRAVLQAGSVQAAAPLPIEYSFNKVLALVGSTDRQAYRQIEDLRRRGVDEVIVDVKKVLGEGPAAEAGRVANAAIQAKGAVVLVHTLSVPLAHRHNGPPGGSGAPITDLVAPVLLSAARALPEACILVVGGETAGALVDGLRLGPLNVSGELSAGVTVAMGEGATPRWIVTKPGSFGHDSLLSEVAYKLLGRAIT